MSDKDRTPLKTVVIPGEQLPEGDSVISVVDRSPNLNERIMLALAEYIDPEKDLQIAYRAVIEAILSEGDDIPEAEPARYPFDGPASPFEVLKGLIDGELTSAPFAKGDDAWDVVFPELAYDRVLDAEARVTFARQGDQILILDLDEEAPEQNYIAKIDANPEDFLAFVREVDRVARSEAEAAFKIKKNMTGEETLAFFRSRGGNAFQVDRAAREYYRLTKPDRAKALVEKAKAKMRKEQGAGSKQWETVFDVDSPAIQKADEAFELHPDMDLEEALEWFEMNGLVDEGVAEAAQYYGRLQAVAKFQRRNQKFPDLDPKARRIVFCDMVVGIIKNDWEAEDVLGLEHRLIPGENNQIITHMAYFADPDMTGKNEAYNFIKERAFGEAEIGRMERLYQSLRRGEVPFEGPRLIREFIFPNLVVDLEAADFSGKLVGDLLKRPYTDNMTVDVGATAGLKAALKTGADTTSPDASPAISTDIPIDDHFVQATNRSEWGAILKGLREENDVSIREMARRFGSSPVRIRQIENPKTDLRTETIQKYLTALGIQFEVGVRVPRGIKPR